MTSEIKDLIEQRSRTGEVVKRGHPFLGGNQTWIVRLTDGEGNPRFMYPEELTPIKN